MNARNDSNALHIERVYDAPVQAVWEAWTDPAQTAQWWGPRGFTLTTHSKDLRPGGTWVYTMHGPDGTDYPNTTLYYEVEPCRKLVYDHGGSADRPPLFRVTVLFSEQGGQTHMAMTMTLPSPEAAAQTRSFIKAAGGNGTWDRLAEYLEKQASGKEQFVINRSFEAPLEQVFDCWTDPEQIRRWLPPTGLDMEYLHADIRAGGSSKYVMRGPGITMYGRAAYLRIEKPHLLVYTQQFIDEHDNIARHPMLPTWPETMLTTVRFSAESAGATRVTVTWEAWEGASAEEIAMFVQHRASMTGGWTGSFDKLEALLAG